MFYENYKKKTNEELIEILNSDTYLLEARETAQKILRERDVNYEIKDEKPQLNKLNCYQLFEKLKDYGVNVYTYERKGLIETDQNNNGLLKGIILLALSLISLIILLFKVFLEPIESEAFTDSSLKQIFRMWLSGTVALFFAGLMQYRKDSRTQVKIYVDEGVIEVKQRNRWSRETFRFSLNEIFVRYEKIKRRYTVFIDRDGKRVKLFDFKEDNVGDKTIDLLSVLLADLNR